MMAAKVILIYNISLKKMSLRVLEQLDKSVFDAFLNYLEKEENYYIRVELGLYQQKFHLKDFQQDLDYDLENLEIHTGNFEDIRIRDVKVFKKLLDRFYPSNDKEMQLENIMPGPTICFKKADIAAFYPNRKLKYRVKIVPYEVSLEVANLDVSIDLTELFSDVTRLYIKYEKECDLPSPISLKKNDG